MNKKKVYIETYGCQMNFYDTEILGGVLTKSGKYEITEEPEGSDFILLNTCSVRENAETTIYNRLMHLKSYKKSNKNLIVGLAGCMAERLRQEVFNKSDLVKVVIGPDEYRRATEILDNSLAGEVGIAVRLSRVETYEDIEPLRTKGISAWIAIMRGCNHFCTYCVVPYTRGRERSRSLESIISEVQSLNDGGFKEVTLLGQNVNSYLDEETRTDFPNLLRKVAEIFPDMRIRYVTSHPLDMSDDLIQAMSEFDNICNYIHLPFQSGSDRILNEMNRNYNRTHYLERICKIKEKLVDFALSTDIIAGFPTETEEDHQATLSLMEEVGFDGAFMFKYSPREGTKAFKMEDDIPEEIKIRRLNEIIDLQNKIARQKNEKEIGKSYEVLTEGPSKKKKTEWMGRTLHNKVVIFDNTKRNALVGDKVIVKITRANSATLFGDVED
ncbi:MAG: tRNA (N6-isopentenyl adenosine(37)-C2)-methylthiotransferase MiaB [Ignavibacteria bacterium GWF2_33_9]|nr:MAG: tRNA (N6-isopentenyl adenosine(37)-C2)-methylthiotransferase MiaB [Ignavibacteria bacterium GWF2_33_9]